MANVMAIVKENTCNKFNLLKLKKEELGSSLTIQQQYRNLTIAHIFEKKSLSAKIPIGKHKNIYLIKILPAICGTVVNAC